MTQTDALERWWQEHSELDLHVAAIERAFSSGSISTASSALEALEDALAEHFDVEERIYFPLLERLSADHAPAIRAARLGHDRVRERLEDIRALITEGELSSAGTALGLLLDRFREHESHETKLILELETLAEGEPVVTR